MKKLVAVFGSSRTNSVSGKVAQKVLEGAREKNLEIVSYYINKMNLSGCMGCGSCRKNGTDCVIQDDLQTYYNDLHTCDVLLLSSPNYYSHVTGPMITFMNRHYCISNSNQTSRLSEGKKLIGIFAQGAPQEVTKYEENYNWYLSIFQRHMELIGKIIIGGNSNLSETGFIMRQAYELGKSL